MISENFESASFDETEHSLASQNFTFRCLKFSIKFLYNSYCEKTVHFMLSKIWLYW